MRYDSRLGRTLQNLFIEPLECAKPASTAGERTYPAPNLRVHRTRNAGASWEPLLRGLPQKGAYETVLRDALTADCFDPAGIYFGTRSGQLFGSLDDGRNWNKILDGLPSIVCVRAAIVEDSTAGNPPLTSRPAPVTRVKSLTTRKSKTATKSRPSRKS